MALCSLSFGLGACSGTAGVAPTTQALPMQALHEHLSGDSQTFGHLYVGDTVAGQKSALIFPLNGGLPGAQSGTLYAQKRFLGPQGLAVGPDGQIYISGGLGRRHIDWSWVDVYPAGASGHTAPARTIQSQGTQGGITVDQNNYLYWGVQIFAPGAHGAATPLTAANLPYVVCTTCHNQHVMNVFAASAANPINGSGTGTYATYFFINGPYNVNDVTPHPTSANSTTQFCRQCHFGESNESNGGTLPTTF